MGLTDSKTGKEKKYSAEEIKEKAKLMRVYALMGIHAAGSGHPGGSLSAMDLIAAAYLGNMKHDPKNPCWKKRDRLFLSKAHVVPALYAALGVLGYYPKEDIVTLRKLGSKFQGHTDRLKCEQIGIEMSGGSLGQGLGISVGDALAAKLDGETYRVYCIMGDGEQQEGSVWEAAMAAGNFKLDNLVAIVDKNELQIDGKVSDVMNIDPLGEKYKAFNWHVIEIDGHNIEEILKAYSEAENTKGKPTVIIAHTVKGKGVSFMENVAGWHGKAPNKEEFETAMKELNFDLKEANKILEKAHNFKKKVDEDLEKGMPKFSKNYWWNACQNMKTEMKPTRHGWGEALSEIGDDERIVTLQADISDSIKIGDFEKKHPERKNRVFSVGIAEQNMMQVAAGLAKEGKIPITGTYGVFASGRPWDQIRTTICYGNLNVKIGGAHGGISVGPDGATHQSLEEFALTTILPNMHVFCGCDYHENKKITKEAVLNVYGPCYLRFGRTAVPIITKPETVFEMGKANVIRFRGEKEKFIDAFEIKLASKYKNENESVSIIATGSMVSEAMRAAWILKNEFGIEARIVNIHTLKPIDNEAIIKATKETKRILTVEEHQVGGFGNIVAGVVSRNKNFDEPVAIDMMGVMDTFGESGEPWELMKKFGLTAEFIAKRAKKLVEKK
ncbi:MAG: transketolase [Candidatus Diapherotrites archaeon]